MKPITLLIACLATLSTAAGAADIYAYGAGGPAPAMQAAADAYGRASGDTVHLTFGPTPKWADAARQNADLIFSGSAHMMGSYTQTFADQLNGQSIHPLYLRPAVIVVRPGNPKKIQGFKDLTRSGMKVIVTNGSGQTGLWEDVAARSGNISDVASLRRNIGLFADNTGIARNTWQQDASFDAWLVWNHWALNRPELGDIVQLEKNRRIYRPMEVALTRKGSTSKEAQAFLTFLQSPAAQTIFQQHGWSRQAR